MKFMIIALVGGLMGFAGSFIPWGSPESFHGTGIPVAIVYWDAPRGKMIDYPNPLAILINPVLGILFVYIMYGCFCLALRICRRIRITKDFNNKRF